MITERAIKELKVSDSSSQLLRQGGVTGVVKSSTNINLTWYIEICLDFGPVLEANNVGTRHRASYQRGLLNCGFLRASASTLAAV